MKSYYVYMLTNWTGEVLYIGVTNDLERRLLEHKAGRVQGFTRKYSLKKLVYFEQSNDINAAIVREKELKGWRRDKKNALVNSTNPDWKDLAEGWYEDPSPCSG